MTGTAASASQADLRAADGRRPGRRGRATREKLLATLDELLESTGYRELKVVDVARAAGTSPATFYQYFADVEQAILVLGEGIMTDAAALAGHVGEDWDEKGQVAGRIVTEFMDFWEAHRSVLRVIDLATEEGDLRFQALRTRALNAITEALAGVIGSGPRRGRVPETLDPMATAGVLVAMLAHVSSHRYGFESWGIRTAEVKKSLTRILNLGVIGAAPTTSRTA
jgi:AcrR family transcriptional regulator